MADKPRTPEGELIWSARKRAGLSGRAAARLAGISEGRWRQIENSYEVAAAGVHKLTVGPADKVARMAQAVGVHPEELEEVKRADAAAELRKLDDARAAAEARDGLERRVARMLANPRSRRRLEMLVAVVEKWERDFN